MSTTRSNPTGQEHAVELDEETLVLLSLHESLTKAPTLAVDDAESSGTREPGMRTFDPGETINGRYVVDKAVGRGSMGEVYAATDPLNGDRRVALKTIRGGNLTPMMVGLLQAEFRTMAKLRHPNLAEAYDFEALSGADDYFFTMQFVEGVGLMDAVGEAEWKVVLDHVVQICRALAYVHSRHLIHHDLKPANVMVTDDGVVKVMDFGIAAEAKDPAVAGVRGTPGYMAPEVVSPEAEVDHRVDLYALGMTTYELLCGRPPFQTESLPRLLYMQQSEDVAFDDGAHEAIPEWLREVVIRLCARQPSDRYPTANAVLADINERGGLDYDIETSETSESYILSSRFVGRSTEYQAINGFIADRVGSTPRARPMMMVGGQSGTGKSRLMREVRQHAQLSRISFAQGRCFEGSSNDFEPLAPVVDYLMRLADAIGRRELVERHARTLLKIAPSGARDRGLTPEPPLADANEERIRLREGFIDFAMALASRVPLVIYIDDLQWARGGLTDLLNALIRKIVITERAGGDGVRLAVVGTYRDDEVAGRPLQGLITALTADDSCAQMPLDPLDVSQVGEVLRSMLGSDELPQPFVARVAEDTDGNPYFVEEIMRMLMERGIVRLEGTSWAAQSDVGEMEIPRTVADALRHRVSLLGNTDRLMLEILAVAGKPMPVSVLGRATDLDHLAVHEALSSLARRRIAVRLSEGELSYRVAHDRMRETVYEDLEPTRRSDRHHALGSALEEVFGSADETHLFDITDHYNACRERFETTEKKNRLAGLNESAGMKARTGAAFDAARGYLGTAIDLLGEPLWDSDYERAANLVKTRMACAYFGDRIEEGHADFELYMRKTGSDLEKVNAILLRADGYTNVGRLVEAIDTIFKGFDLLDMQLERNPTMEHVGAEIAALKTKLADKPVGDLLDEPFNLDPSEMALVGLYSRTYAAAFLTYNQELFAYLTCKGVQRTLTHGVTPASPFGLTMFSFLEIHVLGDIRSGLEFSEVAVELARRTEAPQAITPTLFCAAAFCLPHKYPVSKNVEWLEEAFELGLSTADMLWAGFCANIAITHTGVYADVATTKEVIARHRTLLERLNNPHALSELIIVRQFMRLMAGETAGIESLDDDETDERELREWLYELQDPIPIGYYHAYKQKALCVTGLWEDALATVDETDATMAACTGQLILTECWFYTYMALAHDLLRDPSKADSHAEQMQSKLQAMRTWAEFCPANFAQKVLMMEGMASRAEGRHDAAEQSFLKAAALSEDNGWPLDAAFARELAARTLIDCGRNGRGHELLRDAAAAYDRYGATIKVSAIAEELGDG